MSITTQKQSCSTCMHSAKCWALATNTGKPVSTQNIIINILICRLQLGIDRDKSAQNLLDIFRPGMIRLITHTRQQGNTPGLDMEQLLADMQSTAIEYLLYDYKIGDRGRATPYLFDPHQGFLTKWVKWVVGKSRRFYSHHELHSGSTDDEGHDDSGDVQFQIQGGEGTSSWNSIIEGTSSLRYDPYAPENEESSMMNTVMGIIEDGYTLNSNEYRVMKFCMANGNESNATRHIDGLHIYLARLMGVSRPRITRLYKRARDKMIRRFNETKEEV